MADNFGLKIGLEGEKEFKKAIADINQSFKVLGSEMKLVSSEFGKNDTSMQAVAARSEVLNKQIDAQKQKIEVLRQALKNASESFEENDRRTQSWQIQLNNAEAALNDIERELKANNDALSEASDGYTDAEKSVSKMADEMDDAAKNAGDMGGKIDDAGEKAEKSGDKFEKLGSVLKGIGTAMGAVAAAAGAAAVKLGKEVVSAYADYEQLVGGVDTLFKDNSKELQSYAANAYKTAGLSANEYMETVTSFSASLIQSLGGDTEKAVKYADMAITDKDHRLVVVKIADDGRYGFQPRKVCGMEPPVSGYHLVSALRCGADDGGVENAHLHDAVDGLLHELVVRHLEGVVLEGTNL